MDHLLPVLIADEIRHALPGLRVHTMVFGGARIGVGHAGLDPLRQRLVRRVDQLCERHGHIADIPTVRALIGLLADLGQDPYANAPSLLRRGQAMTRRDPFPVENDAQDAALLISLYYMVPAFLLDVDQLRPPLVLRPSSDATIGLTPTATTHASSALVLSDEEKILRSVQHEIGRAPVTELTRSFVLVLLDPGVDGGLDAERTVQRVDNWISTLTSAELLEATVSP